ncbi:tRNA pseudouridine(55) synthase TruB [Methyloceanibacter sp.]|uniref:tRNA pseudouridine(55) synthase TruB n=1 Tax=Methyloceanibacter sp. TaxID=1965321 RepID=UPI002D33B99A|nr:tRNA pseudouridine(55) synthase TruB [Methyloceanibacter sp.]HZP08707.1 tRNA pseudouridine(55) synthase TruB [Methyloceanibacter sp.]
MARRRKGSPVSGWLVLDKPQGMTSTKAVSKVRHLFDAAKAGHAGTLDPLATGVLPIALGEATKTVPFAMEGLKTYRFTVRFGTETDTDDAEGAVVAQSEARPSTEAIEGVLPRFVGEISQVPPRFSALKVDGARAYDLARDKEEFELAPRIVSIERLALVSRPDPDRCVLEAECGKGTYVRALARDLGRALGTCVHVEALRRTRVGAFGEEDAVTLDALESLKESGPKGDGLHIVLKPVEAALGDLPALSVSQPDAARLRQGQPVLLRGRDAPILTGSAYAMSRGMLVALGEVEGGEFKPKRIFNLPG